MLNHVQSSRSSWFHLMSVLAIYISFLILLIPIYYHLMPVKSSFQETCLECSKLITQFQNIPNDSPLITSTKTKLSKSLEILNEALNTYEYNEIAISYNGGKDCLVMLIVLLAQIYNHYTKDGYEFPSNFQSLTTVLINDEEQFPELIEFIDRSASLYNLKLVKYNNKSLKDGFRDFLHDYPSIKSIIVGTRKTDPFASELQPFTKTDNDWPEFMRIHPILDWHYDEIWCFLKATQVDYCKLYDLGYTSIGGIDTTIRNPCLLKPDGEYLPAFELTGSRGDELERDGRNVSK